MTVDSAAFSGAPGRTGRAVGVWLLVCAVLVLVLGVVGAVTRLTNSGLSITEWQPILGALPPMTETDWQTLFDRYQATPEYRLINPGMTLDDFRTIFWWEWAHRNGGRIIGLVFLAGFLWFWATRQIPRNMLAGLAGVVLLGALQGLAGWLMVMSGLVDRPSVSHFRLAIHLGLALLIYGWLLSLALNLLYPAPRSGFDPEARVVRRFGMVALTVLCLTVTWGAFVAGLDAGLAYNTWPLMGEHWLPPEAQFLQPWWRNPVENSVAVQFIHRWLGIATAAVMLSLWFIVRTSDLPAGSHRIADLLAGAVLVQVGLGISTLLYGVPVPLGAAHQTGAFLLVGLTVWLLHEVRTPRTAVPG